MSPNMPMASVLWLLVCFQAKHFLADYPLQTHYMLGKFKAKDWVAPLAAHCAVHMAMSWGLVFIFLYYKGFKVAFLAACALATFQFVAHFVMDRIKASPHYLGRYDMLSKREAAKLVPREMFSLAWRENTLFWWSLGFDQMVHHLTDIATVAGIYWAAAYGVG